MGTVGGSMLRVARHARVRRNQMHRAARALGCHMCDVSKRTWQGSCLGVRASDGGKQSAQTRQTLHRRPV